MNSSQHSKYTDNNTSLCPGFEGTGHAVFRPLLTLHSATITI